MLQLPHLVERAGFAAPDDLLLLRARLAAAVGVMEDRGAATLSSGTNRILRFGDPGAETLVVHFHGGGYRQGQPEMSARYAASLANAASVEVWCPAYRLAPEHPFPAAILDAAAVLSHVAERRPRYLVLAGDSAGGGLAAALAQICATQAIGLSGLILHSPWLDLRVASASYAANADSDPLFSKHAASSAAAAYLQGHAPTDPLASPVLADPALFPPSLLSVGSGEVLLDDARTFHEQLRDAGREVRLCQIDAMEHVAVTRGLDNVGASLIFEETVRFLARLR